MISLDVLNENNASEENDETINAGDLGKDFLKAAEIKFQGYKNKKSKYMLVKNNLSDDFIEKVKKYSYSQNGFSLEKPKLIITVTGGAKRFTIDNDTKVAFKQGLVKIAKSTNAWIITGGSNTGCMRLVGDAVEEEDLDGNNITVLGIAQWSRINRTLNEDSRFSINSSNIYAFSESTLNPNHSCFIFVDNPDGDEIDFRTKFEQAIKYTENVPIVQIVLEGGIGTLKTIIGAIENEIPTLLVAGTKGCADLLKEIKQTIVDKNLSNDSQVTAELKKILKKKDYEAISRKPEALDLIKKILSDRKRFIRSVNIFEMNEEENDYDIEPKILHALSKVENAYHMIELAIKWNRLDIAKNELRQIEIQAANEQMREKDIDLRENAESYEDIEIKKILSQQELEDIFAIALIENRAKFVEFILSYLDLYKFLRYNRLKDLYDYALQKHNNQLKYLHKLRIFKQKQKRILSSSQKYETQTMDTLTLDDMRLILKYNFPSLKTEFIPANLENQDDYREYCENPEMILFFWALLTNRVEVAKVFWRFGKYQICFALMAAKLLNFFASSLAQDKLVFETHANEFEKYAIGILDTFERYTRDEINDVLVIRYLNFIQMDCLQLAVECKCKQFVSHRVAQKALEDIWNGWNGNSEISELRKTEEELKSCQKKYNENKKYVFNNINMNMHKHIENPSLSTYLRKLINIPKTKFIFHICFYAIFLLLFTYTMLFTIEPYQMSFNEGGERIMRVDSNESFVIENISNETIDEIIDNDDDGAKFAFPIRETILFIWIISIMLQEIKQFFFSSISKYDLKLRLRMYVKNGWNWLDIFGCSLFIVGYVLLLIAIRADSSQLYIGARIFLSYDLALWYIRSLQFCLLSKILGPKLVMIQKMFQDLLYFLVIIATFLLAFGVTVQSLINPYEYHTFDFVLDIIDISYWPIFGELNVLEKLSVGDCDENSGEECLDLATVAFSYLLLMIYMIIASVLLLNLLIAMFSSTFEGIQENSDIVWKNQNYKLISEYMELSFLPPPFNVFYYVYNLFKKNQQAEESNDEQIIVNDVLVELEQKCTEKMLRNVDDQDLFAIINRRFEKIEKQLNQICKLQLKTTNV